MHLVYDFDGSSLRQQFDGACQPGMFAEADVVCVHNIHAMKMFREASEQQVRPRKKFGLTARGTFVITVIRQYLHGVPARQRPLRVADDRRYATGSQMVMQDREPHCAAAPSP